MERAQHGAVGGVADELKERVGNIAAEAARTAVDSNIDQVAGIVDDRYGPLLDGAVNAFERTSRMVRQRPIGAVLCAVAIGFVLGRS